MFFRERTRFRRKNIVLAVFFRRKNIVLAVFLRRKNMVLAVFFRRKHIVLAVFFRRASIVLAVFFRRTNQCQPKPARHRLGPSHPKPSQAPAARRTRAHTPITRAPTPRGATISPHRVLVQPSKSNNFSTTDLCRRSASLRSHPWYPRLRASTCNGKPAVARTALQCSKHAVLEPCQA